MSSAREKALANRVRVTLTPRGFRDYGSVKCSYGTTLTVRESSSAEGRFVWIFAKEGPELHSGPGEASAHLSREQAMHLVRKLLTWLSDVEVK